MKHLSEIQDDLRSGKYSLTDLVKEHLHAIKNKKDLNIFLETFNGDALMRSTVIDEKIKRGSAGKLGGMIIGIKDTLCYQGHKVTAASHILDEFESIYSATAVERLLEEDAIIIGRLNCDEFAMGSSNEFSVAGPTRNPHNPDYVPGGSSGGSAAAVAAGLCHATLGSDTGGSIRQPASFCGVWGMKPTYGTVSRHGLVAYASSFDQIGPFASNPEDLAKVLEVIAGPDAYDSTLSQKEPPKFSETTADDKKHTIGYIRECLDAEGLDPEIKAHMEEQIESLKAAGHKVKAVEFPYLDHLVPIYYLLTTAEASSNLARYDGVHFGYRSEKAHDMESTYKLSRTEGFGTEVKRRIMLGTFVLSSGYYEAYYGKAQKARRLIRDTTDALMEECDFLLSPTTPHPAFKIGRDKSDPTVMYLEDIFTVQANICGNPAISIPTGTHSNGLPFGMQLLGRRFEDNRLIAFSKSLTHKVL